MSHLLPDQPSSKDKQSGVTVTVSTGLGGGAAGTLPPPMVGEHGPLAASTLRTPGGGSVAVSTVVATAVAAVAVPARPPTPLRSPSAPLKSPLLLSTPPVPSPQAEQDVGLGVHPVRPRPPPLESSPVASVPPSLAVVPSSPREAKPLGAVEVREKDPPTPVNKGAETPPTVPKQEPSATVEARPVPPRPEERPGGKPVQPESGVGQLGGSPPSSVPLKAQHHKATHLEHKGKKGVAKKGAQDSKAFAAKSKPVPLDKQVKTKPGVVRDEQAKAKPATKEEQAKTKPGLPEDQAKVIPAVQDDQAKVVPISIPHVKVEAASNDEVMAVPTTSEDQATSAPSKPGAADGGKDKPGILGSTLKRELLKARKAVAKSKSPAARGRIKAEIREQSFQAESIDNSEEEEEGDGEEEAAQSTKRAKALYQRKL